MSSETARYIAKCRSELIHPRKGKARTKAFQRFLKEETGKERKEAAEMVLRVARSHGSIPRIDGEWVIWEPPLPSRILMVAVDLADQIAELLTNEDV